MKRIPTTLRSSIARAWARADRAAPAVDRVLAGGFWQPRAAFPPAHVIPLRTP